MKGDLAYTSLETTWLTSSSGTIKLVRAECPSLLEWCALFSEQLDLITRLRFIFKKERRRREGGGGKMNIPAPSFHSQESCSN